MRNTIHLAAACVVACAAAGCLFPSQKDDTSSSRPAAAAAASAAPAPAGDAPDAGGRGAEPGECSAPWVFYADWDGDGWGAGPQLRRCPTADGGSPAGFSGNAGDCDDEDPHAFPGQAQFFAVPRSNGGFDYDCDGVESKEITKRDCFNGACDTGGWIGVVPACGASGETSDVCIPPTTTRWYCEPPAQGTAKTQGCR